LKSLLNCMNTITILGAGRSATAMINYLQKCCEKYHWNLVVCDADPELAKAKAGQSSRTSGIGLDATNEEQRGAVIRGSDIVVSMLPPWLHLLVVKDCLRYHKHLINASYVSPEIMSLDAEAKAAGILFLCEMGLDPGIDHMSAMKIFHEIWEKGGKVLSFRSHTGGLIAPESDDNPWHYKFSWNPRNVVLAAKSGGRYLQDGTVKYIPYQRIFEQTMPVEVHGEGLFESYANRDSISYIDKYGLNDIQTIFRGTLRKPGFCKAWNALIKIGLTDEVLPISESVQKTYGQLITSLLPDAQGTLAAKVAKLLGESPDSDVISRLEWLGLFSDHLVSPQASTPADALEQLLLEKWSLKADDKDMIVMHHEIDYLLEGKQKGLTSSLVCKGSDSVDTAMSKLVGLPMAIFIKDFMLNGCTLTGLHIPVSPEIYIPVLKELEEAGIIFQDQHF
jgi:saccharopine dehydrogenase-like NADP-dependent oxidoreductase